MTGVEIDARAAGCRGDGPCMDCGTPDTPVWSAPNDLWNHVVGSPNGFLCPWCFVVRAEQVVGPQVWDLRPRKRQSPTWSCDCTGCGHCPGRTAGCLCDVDLEKELDQ